MITLLMIINSFIFIMFGENAFCGQDINKIIIIFRYDDFSVKSNTYIEENIIDIFKKRNMPITISVMPFISSDEINNFDNSIKNYQALSFTVKHEVLHDKFSSPNYVTPLSSQKAEILKNGIKEGMIEVALHGYVHQDNQKHDNYKSEFSGIDYNNQEKMIAEGENLLEDLLGKKITIFVPPWNNYDVNTLRAIEKLGFEYLSADIPGEVDGNVKLKYFPVTCGISQLENSINIARKMKYSHPIITVLFHSYDFIEDNNIKGVISINSLTSLLDVISSQSDISVLSINGAFNAVQDFSVQRYINNSNYRSVLFYLPKSLHIFPVGIYLTTEYANICKMVSLLILILFYIVIFAFSVSVSFLFVVNVIRRFRRISSVIKFTSSIMFVLLSYYSILKLSVNYKGAISCIVIIGIYFGILASFLKTRLSHNRGAGM